MFKNRFVSLLALTLSLLPASAVFAAGQSQGGGPAAAGFNETGLPITTKPVAYKMVARRRVINGPYEDMVFFKRLEEKTNVRVEWNAIPEGQYNEKKNLLFASNDLPDAFFGRFTLTSNDIVLYSAQKMLIPLDGLIDKYAPNLKAIFEKNPDFKAMATAPDGHIYAMPFVYAVGVANVPDNLFLYKPWLDKLGLKVPNTIDEFYAVLKAFKEKDPNGNGKADEVPFTFVFGQDIFFEIASLFGAFGRSDNTGGPAGDVHHLSVENGKVVFTADKPEYKAALAYFHRFFAEGLVDKESFTQDRKQFMAKGKSTEVVYGGYMAWNDFDFGAERAKDYVVVPPLAGKDGKRRWSWRPIDNMNGTGFSISPRAKNPEILVRWADQFYDKDVGIEANFGPVGINLEKKADGSYDYLPTPKDSSYDEFRFKNAPAGDAPMAFFPEDFGKVIPRQAAAQRKYDIITKYYKPYAADVMYPSGLMFSLEDSKRLQILRTDIMKYVEEMRARWLMNGGVENEWNAYLAKLKDIGLEEFVQIFQKNYDRIYKKK